ncbi:MAG: universal stress protein [Rhodobacter sp.]|nr:universal stress protein [Rhodobacter sp.]
MIRKIMVPVRGDGKGDNVLRHAAVLAHNHKAHIVVTHCRPRAEDLMPYGVPVPDFLKKQILEQSRQVADLEEAGLRDELHALAVSLKLDPQDRPSGDRASVAFVEEAGRQVDVIKRHGRLADVIAVAQPDYDRNLGSNTLKAALFRSGRPVLMCPRRDAAPAKLGEVIAVAWNGSAEAARALAQGMSTLQGAKAVHILSNDENAGAGTTAADVVDYLRLHGIGADIRRFESGKSVGKALLATCADIGADMLVMGAYGDSHERETLFGGNTQTVVEKSTMPVLFSH